MRAGSARSERRISYERQLTPEQMRQMSRFYLRFPGYARRWELIAEYARSSGGLTLEFWKLFRGPAFGLPQLVSLDICAERLSVPISRLRQIGTDTLKAVEPKLREDPEWQRLARMTLEQRRALLRGGEPGP